MYNTSSKSNSLDFFKDMTEESYQLGESYEKSMGLEKKKALGKFYTPSFIIDFILDKTLEKADLIKEPFIKVLDPSCGSGFFLIAAYRILREKFIKVLPNLRDIYSDNAYIISEKGLEREISGEDYWQLDNINYHILKHCIYGADIDKKALWLCRRALLSMGERNYNDELNIVYGDSLFPWEKYYDQAQIKKELGNFMLVYALETKDKIEYMDRVNAEEILKRCQFWSNKFHYIIGNPPYLGHKKLDMDYKEWLLVEYKEVFKDKSDLSHCFYKRAQEIACRDGIIAYISSRYFMEGPTGMKLREYLKENLKIDWIVDFCGEKVFKNLGIATAIFFLDSEYEEENEIDIWKYKGSRIESINPEDFNKFRVKQAGLKSERWLLLSQEEEDILDIIEKQCDIKLGDIVESFQGVITGRDRAFVMDQYKAELLSIEKNLLMPWIKNSHIERYRIRDSDLRLIYSDWIDNIDNYPNSISHIERSRETLENRRECKRGTRLWYQLQWGRNPGLFMQDKIVYPYKSKSNRFALDRQGNFSSADVYSFIMKDGISNYNLYFLLGVLNSRFYEYYFKLIGKMMGSGIYDYYPNTVMELWIPDYESCKEIEDLAKELIELYKGEEGQNLIEEYENKIEDILKDYFGLKEWAS